MREKPKKKGVVKKKSEVGWEDLHWKRLKKGYERKASYERLVTGGGEAAIEASSHTHSRVEFLWKLQKAEAIFSVRHSTDSITIDEIVIR